MKNPELKLQFTAGEAAATKKAPRVTFIPVFKIKDARAAATRIADFLGEGALESVLESYFTSGGFSGRSGEILNLIPHGLVLGGIGPASSFHPESLGALFRNLGAKVMGYENITLNLFFSEELGDAIDDFDRLSAPEPKKKKASAKKAAKKAQTKVIKENDDDSDTLPDYLTPASLEESVSQAVACMQIGADNMELLKKDYAKKKSKIGVIGIIAPGLSQAKVTAAVDRGLSMGRMVNGARYVASLPGNYFSPAEAEKYAKALASKYKLGIKVFNHTQLKKMGCGGIVAVGQGSVIPPRMIVLEYKPGGRKKSPPGTKPIVLVGKGVTFDTGGISIKPSPEMHEMKFDMCGSALVLHAVALAAERKLPVEVVGLVGMVENMPDGAAIKPGDVYTAYNGLTIEVQNTDAEGRLVLGDVLAYACEKYDPRYIMDFATLTGACVIALGHECGGVMTPNEELALRIDAASRKSLDRVWRLPHWHQYGAGLKSDISDARNIAGRPAGTISAMRFLAKFVKPGVPWAHFDIAGSAWRGKPSGTQCKGATGWGVRLVNQLLEDL